MNNVLFNRDTLKVVGQNRPALPFEVEVKNVNTEGLAKSVPTFEEVPKTDNEGNQLFLLPQEPSEVRTTEDVRFKSAEPSEEASMVTIQQKQPILDAEGNHLQYEKTEVVTTPATYDEEGNLLTEETSEIVDTGIFIKCYTMQESEEQEKDAEGNLLYWHTKPETKITFEEQPDLEITEEDERWTEALKQATITEEGTKTLTFEEHMEEFTYGDIVKHKEASVIAGTFYDAGKLFEDPQSVVDTELVSFQADLGFGFVSIPAGGEFRTVKVILPKSSQFIGVRTETSLEGLKIEIGRLASSLYPINSQSEAVLDQSSSEVYVRFSNLTDERIDLHSFSLLV